MEASTTNNNSSNQLIKQIVDDLKSSSSILITIPKSPSIDQLCAAISIHLTLHQLNKNITTIFTGAIPNILTFLHPEKIFEDNIDSLRDFVIYFNATKAKQVQFKKDGDIIKVFITPTKEGIQATDLGYDSGDFNIQTVLALGISKQEEIEEAITTHGRILHDSKTLTINNSSMASSIGSVDWHDPSFSCISEMAYNLCLSLNSPNPINQEVATPLLTGIVAETERFSNSKTDPQIMSVAAQLMALGANNQLLSSQLDPNLPKIDLEKSSTTTQNNTYNPLFNEQKINDSAKNDTVLSIKAEPDNTALNAEPLLHNLSSAISKDSNTSSSDLQYNEQIISAAIPAADQSQTATPITSPSSDIDNTPPSTVDLPKSEVSAVPIIQQPPITTNQTINKDALSAQDHALINNIELDKTNAYEPPVGLVSNISVPTTEQVKDSSNIVGKESDDIEKIRAELVDLYKTSVLPPLAPQEGLGNGSLPLNNINNNDQNPKMQQNTSKKSNLSEVEVGNYIEQPLNNSTLIMPEQNSSPTIIPDKLNFPSTEQSPPASNLNTIIPSIPNQDNMDLSIPASPINISSIPTDQFMSNNGFPGQVQQNYNIDELGPPPVPEFPEIPELESFLPPKQ